jgi:hypothetical protein
LSTLPLDLQVAFSNSFEISGSVFLPAISSIWFKLFGSVFLIDNFGGNLDTVLAIPSEGLLVPDNRIWLEAWDGLNVHTWLLAAPAAWRAANRC